MIKLIEAVKNNEIIEINKILATEQAIEELLSRDHSGITPIMYAAKKDSDEILKILLQYIHDRNVAIDLNTKSSETNMTALHYAAQAGSSLCVKTLLATDKVNCNITTGYGNTALMMAIKNCHLDCVELLAPVSNLTLKSFFDGKKSVFDLANDTNSVEIKQCLQRYKFTI